MIDKYLPVGTVCTLKGSNKKTIIVGFLPIEYNGNVKMYDYQGCAYPEGLLLKNSLVSFNSSDIEKIDFLGYKDELHEKFNKILLNSTKQLDLNDDNLTTVSNFQFDENGVIVFDATVAEPTSVSISETTAKPVENPFNIEYRPAEKIVNPNQHEILSPFVFDENGVIVEDNYSKMKVQEAAESPFKFDENGVIIEDGTSKEEKAESPFKFDENGVIVEDGTSKEEKAESPFKFDENGVIIEDGTSKEEKVESPFKFDENGVIVEDGTSKEEKPESPFKFDENGVIIEDGTSKEAKAESPFKFDENGVIVEDGTSKEEKAESPFKFDENGVIIEDGTSKEEKAESPFKFDENGVIIEDGSSNK